MAPGGTTPAGDAHPARDTVVVVSALPATHEAFLVPQAAALADHGHRVVGVANGLSTSPAAAAYDTVHDIPLSRRPTGRDAARATAAIRRILLEEQADLVWLHTSAAAAVGRVAAASLPRRQRPLVVVMAHGFNFGSVRRGARGLGHRELERFLSMVTDHLQTVNREDYELARRMLGRTAANTELTRGVGVDVDALVAARADRDRARAELGLGDDDRAVLSVGVLDPDKRTGDAIDAVGRLGPPHRLFVVGTGPERAHLEAQAARLPAGTVTFLGDREDVPALLAAADVLVHPSSREGLPTAVLQAQAAGLPVVGARVRGTADLLTGGAGLLHPVARPDRLAESITRVLDDQELRDRVVRIGQRRAAHYRVDQATMAALSISLCLSARKHRRR